jgi:hypothetical protein
MLAAQQGGLVNLSALGNSLGVSYHTVQHGLDLLEGIFCIRRLPPYFCNIRKRLVKAPRVFIRDTGLLLHLLNVATLEDLHNHPIRGASWEGFVGEDLMRRERMAHPFTQFFFWRTATGQEADLVFDRSGEKWWWKSKPTAAPIHMMPGSWKLFWMTWEPPKGGLSAKGPSLPNSLPESGPFRSIRILDGCHRMRLHSRVCVGEKERRHRNQGNHCSF